MFEEEDSGSIASLWDVVRSSSEETKQKYLQLILSKLVDQIKWCLNPTRSGETEELGTVDSRTPIDLTNEEKFFLREIFRNPRNAIRSLKIGKNDEDYYSISSQSRVYADSFMTDDQARSVVSEALSLVNQTENSIRDYFLSKVINPRMEEIDWPEPQA